MFTGKDLEAQFYEGNRSDHLPFVVGDSVKIMDGPSTGELGAVISVFCIASDLYYLVETADGSDLKVSAGLLELLE